MTTYDDLTTDEIEALDQPKTPLADPTAILDRLQDANLDALCATQHLVEAVRRGMAHVLGEPHYPNLDDDLDDANIVAGYIFDAGMFHPDWFRWVEGVGSVHRDQAPPSQPAGDRLAYPIPDAAARLGIGRTTLYEVIQRGELPTIRIGRRRLVTEAALVAYLDRLSQDA